MSAKPRKAIELTPQQRAEHRAIRDAFRTWHPGPEELIASGEAARLGLDVIYFPAREVVHELKAAREVAGLTLADAAHRSGVDEAELAQLEAGNLPNPAMDTLWRYAAAVGRRLRFSAEPIEDTRGQLAPARGDRSRSKKPRKQQA